MSKLQALINNHKEQLALDKQIMAQRAAEHQAALVAKARERLILAADQWGLDEVLGLHKIEEYPNGQGVVRCVGEICVEGVHIATHAETPVADWGNIEIGLADRAMGFWRYEQASPTWSETVFTPWIVKLATTFIDERAAMLTKLQPRLATARKLVALAKQYEERVTYYRECRRQWAERWTRELWTPWTLWRVRYVPLCNMVGNDSLNLAVDAHGPEVIMCIERPDEIVESLRQFPTTTVHRVETDGLICEMEIPSFLDAEQVFQEEISIGKSLAYHRRYHGCDVVVNVPAIEQREPDKAPELADFPQWVAEVDDHLAEIARRFWESDYGWGDIIERSAEQWVEDWGSVFD